jgi:hypothetical protein
VAISWLQPGVDGARADRASRAIATCAAISRTSARCPLGNERHRDQPQQADARQDDDEDADPLALAQALDQRDPPAVAPPGPRSESPASRPIANGPAPERDRERGQHDAARPGTGQARPGGVGDKGNARRPRAPGARWNRPGRSCISWAMRRCRRSPVLARCVPRPLCPSVVVSVFGRS